MAGPSRPRWKALVLGEDPLLRYLVRESLQAEGVTTFTEARSPQEVSPAARIEGNRGVVVLCLNGPSEHWQKGIEETRRAVPQGKLVAVTFGGAAGIPGMLKTDGRLGADAMVRGPPRTSELKDAVFQARLVRSRPETRPTIPRDVPRPPPASP